MFDIGWSELVIIGVVALIVIGPKELPGVLRMTGQWIGKVRRMASDFQGQFQEAMREAEMSDLKQQVDELAGTTRDLTSDFDPIGSMNDTFEEAFDDKDKTDKGKTKAADADALPAPAPDPVQTAIEPPSPPSADDTKTAASPPTEKSAAGGQSA